MDKITYRLVPPPFFAVFNLSQENNSNPVDTIVYLSSEDHARSEVTKNKRHLEANIHVDFFLFKINLLFFLAAIQP
jgi:hypothetical protein